MKSAIIDVNVFLDLIKLQMLASLFKIGFQMYTTQEIIDQLNENQSGLLREFIGSDQLTVYRFSENELEEVTGLTAIRALEFADKSVAWLSIQLNGTLISGNRLLRKFCESRQLEAGSMIWFFDLLIEKQLIIQALAAQKMEQLLKTNRIIPHEECEKKIKEWKESATIISL
jgi:hypothetical protein